MTSLHSKRDTEATLTRIGLFLRALGPSFAALLLRAVDAPFFFLFLFANALDDDDRWRKPAVKDVPLAGAREDFLPESRERCSRADLHNSPRALT